MNSDQLSTPILDQEFQQTVFNNFWKLFVEPEVLKRQRAGRLPDSTPIYAFQVIFYPDERENEFRLNDEIRAKLHITSGLEIEPGRQYRLTSELIDQLGPFHLTEDDDPNAAHVTFVLLDDLWRGSFDFIYNRKRASEHLDAARQFLSCANYAMQREAWIAFIDNLFSAAELGVKAFLFSFDPNTKARMPHDQVRENFKVFSEGNINNKVSSIFYSLSTQRVPIRYLHREFAATRDECERMFAEVAELITHAEGWVSR
jgi:hypothetical protein